MENWLKNKIALLLILFALGFTAAAQKYNYFGYKYVVNAKATFGSNYPFFPQNVVLHPSWMASAGIGKMFSEKFMLEFNGGYFGSNYDTGDETRDPMTGISVNATFKFFMNKFKGAVAPVGRYIALEISYYNLAIQYNHVLNQISSTYKPAVQSNYSALSLSLVLGKNIVVSDRILLGVGTRLTLPPPLIVNSDTTDPYAEKNTKLRLWSATALQGFFTIGYLF